MNNSYGSKQQNPKQNLENQLKSDSLNKNINADLRTNLRSDLNADLSIPDLLNQIVKNKNSNLSFGEKKVLMNRINKERILSRNSMYNGISHSMPTPNSFEFFSLVPIVIDENSLKEEAYSKKTSEQFFNIISKMKQKLDSKIQFDIEQRFYKLGTERNNELKESFAELKQNFLKIKKNNSSLVTCGLLLHHYLNMMHKKYGLIKFLKTKTNLELILLQYSCHDPVYSIKTEMRELSNYRGEIEKIFGYLHSLMVSTEFQEAQIKSSGNKPKSFDILAVHRVPDGVHLGVENNVELSSSFTINKKETKIELSYEKNPTTLLKELNSVMHQIISSSMSTIVNMEEQSKKTGYNMFTHEMNGEIIASDNFKEMERIRSNLFRDFLRSNNQAKLLDPRIFIKLIVKMKSFAGEPGFGDIEYTVNLDPGQYQEFQSQSMQIIRREMNKQNSIFECSSEKVKDSIQNNITNEQSSSNSNSTDYNEYVDNKFETNHTDGLDQNYNLGSGSKFQPYVNAGVEIDATKSKETSASTDDGTSLNASNTLQEAVKIINNAVDMHARDVSTERKISATEILKQIEELTQTNTEIRKSYNPNRCSPLSVFYRSVLQEYVSYLLLKDIRIVFDNGVVKRESSLLHYNQFLDMFIKEDCIQEKDRIISEIKKACHVIDYQGRVIEFAKFSDNSIAIKRTLYYNLLKDADLYNERDSMMQEHDDYLEGIVLSREKYSMVRPGVISDTRAGILCLDDVEFKKEEASLGKMMALTEESVATANAKKLENEIVAEMLKFIKSITEDSDAVKRQSDLFFMLLSRNFGNLFDSRFTAAFLDDLRKKKNPLSDLQIEPGY